jgi:methionyl-tRNA formyltransferase
LSDIIGVMRIIFAGTPDVAVPTLRELVASGHEVVLVITREDARVGRSGELHMSAVALAAEELNLPVLRANRLTDEHAAMVSDLDADIGVVVAYGALLREPMLSAPGLGWVNTHFSLLPRWRGAAPVQHALLAGDEITGVTIFQLDEGLDTGAIVIQESFPIPVGVNAGQLLVELAEFAAPLLIKALEMVEDSSVHPVAQVGEPTRAPKLSRNDAWVDFSRDADSVLRRWSGVTPEPGAWAVIEGQPLKLHALGAFTPQGATIQLQPGECQIIDGVACVGTATKTLELIQVQPSGKSKMTGAAWLRGKHRAVVLS